MPRVKEIYLWIILFALIIAGAIYLRYYYQPSLSVSLSFVNHSSESFYPYEQISNPIAVENTGSSGISNLSFGLYINNNITRTYRISIPAGKTAIVHFNFTPTSSGNFAIRMVADPNMLYNIQDRGAAQATWNVYVSNAETPKPYALFNSNGLIGEDSYNMSPSGYALSIFLFNNTGANQFGLTPSQQINDLIYPTLDVYYNYIESIQIAHAYYKNHYLVSMWVSGYLGPSAISTVAIGKGLNVTTVGDVTLINFGGNTTMCSWYSGGWLKTLASVNYTSCDMILNVPSYKGINVSYESKFSDRNSKIYNYSGFIGNGTYSGQWSELKGSLMFQSIEKGANFTNVCYGSIEEVDNVSYCNTFLIESGNTVLVKTNALLGSYNLTVWGIGNETMMFNQSALNIKQIEEYNITGPVSSFVSGFANSCYINTYIGCYDATWNYNSLSLALVNGYNSSVAFGGIKCFISGSAPYTYLNQTIAPGGYAATTIPCYDNGTVISGVPLGLNVHLTLTYKALNQTSVANGYASLVR